MEISTLTMYHCLAFVWYFFVAYSITHVKTEERPSEVFLYGGQWKYLTVLNLVSKSCCTVIPIYHFELLGNEINFTVLQAVFYGVSFLADVLRLIKKLRCAKCIISSRDLLFSVLAFPVSTFVCISFWTLYTYNRELVYPKSLDGVIPLWLNHAMHTAVLPFALLEILALPHRYPAKKKGLILLGFVAFLYIS
ncbi:Androgen-dependent TFPI-regulating protein [Lonchura striata]|uniref:Androgen-dependent TFPI-regulating protein n=1 Tax=Lonchura striata TaxID=40157 RepID=A0A218UIY9_9PASE|nr:Androgen-dependent TFPI-regulating protein [Lonchura striata domestica]